MRMEELLLGGQDLE